MCLLNHCAQTIPPVSLGFLPIYHTYGLHYVCIRPVWMVIPTLIIPKWNADVVLDLIPKYVSAIRIRVAEMSLIIRCRYRVSILSLTPPAILQLVNHPRIRKTDLSSLVLTGSGAAHLPPKLGQAFKKLLKNAQNVGEGTCHPCRYPVRAH